MHAASTTRLGNSAVDVTRLAAGTATLGNVFGEVDETAASDLLAACESSGITYLDTAPLYGVGLSEGRLGAALREHDPSAFVISTKVGRTLDESTPRGWVHDFSRDAILRGFDSSLTRLGREYCDVVYLHDPDDYEDQVYESAWGALIELREQGRVGAIGVGVNQWELPLRLIRRLPLDVVLLAGRYTLLDTSGAGELLPECLERGVSVALGGVFNSGVLIDPKPGSWFDYRPASAEVLSRARAIKSVAENHGITLPHLAISFAAAHPAVTSTIVGVATAEALTNNVESMDTPVDEAVWHELDALGLLPEHQFVIP
jgi:D-threo-aldose 1-dehydrogenase